MFKDVKDIIIEDKQKTIERLNEHLDTEKELKWKLIEQLAVKDEFIAQLQQQLREKHG